MIRKDIISLAVIEKGTGPHAPLMKRELEKRKEALELVDDISSLAEYIGGKSESSGLGDWIIEKEAFPGVVIHIVYEHADEEFPSTLKDFYSGERLGIVPAEDLSHISLAIVNHMVRYIRTIVPDDKLPDICRRV
ncbi:MAG: hypothetical protein SVY53_08975 [Chloroflexota bacterium]|nr:hypothetical protein [Chloroflexota bacterium]